MLHGKGLNRIPRVVFPHCEDTPGSQATINVIHRPDPFHNGDVMKDAVAKNQIEILLGNILVRGNQLDGSAFD
jgi:hypothetical protein